MAAELPPAEQIFSETSRLVPLLRDDQIESKSSHGLISHRLSHIAWGTCDYTSHVKYNLQYFQWLKSTKHSLWHWGYGIERKIPAKIKVNPNTWSQEIREIFGKQQTIYAVPFP